MNRFVIEVPPKGVETLRETLEDRELRFDPSRKFIALNERTLDNGVALGHHIPEMLEGISHLLDEEGLTPRVPTDWQEWSSQRRHAFLQFAINNFIWDGTTALDGWWQHDGITWEELARRNPGVFGD